MLRVKNLRCGYGEIEAVKGVSLHANEDHFIVETDSGELVVTTLCREAMPLLRYRTGIACTTSRSACPCGRQGIILHPGKRLDGRLRVNEMPLYEEQIAGVLSKTEAAGQPFHIDMSEHSIHIGVEVSEALFGDKMLVLANLRERIKTEFLLRLGIPCEVSFVSPSMT